MRQSSLLFLGILFCADAYALKIGDTEEQAIRELGKPKEVSPAGPGRSFFYYEHGMILIHNGKVSNISLSSLEDFKKTKEREAALKAEQERIQKAQARLAELERDEKARSLAKQEAAEKRRSLPELSSNTTFFSLGEKQTEPGIYVDTLSISLTQAPAPPPYNEVRWGNSGGGPSYRYVQTVHPPAPPPTAVNVRVNLFNSSNAELTSIDVVYALQIGDETTQATSNSSNRSKFIYPNTSGTLEIAIPLTNKEMWEEMRGLEKITLRFLKSGKEIEVGRTVWERKTN
jgi:hypothetical protein